MVGCTAVSERIRVSWTISWTSDSSRGVTFQTEPSLVGCSSRGRLTGPRLVVQVL
jgi:hypothetical protein